MLRVCGGSLCALLLVLSSSAQAQWYNRSFSVMGTSARVELWDDKQVHAEEAMRAVEDEMRRIDQLMSPYIERSELSRINREAAREPVVISAEMFGLIKTSLRYSDITDGAFDITFSSVGFLYDYRAHKRPDEKAIASHLDGVNYRHIELDEAANSIHFSQPGVRIDLGGIAKGHAVDHCIQLLKSRGITNAFVNAGGDSYVLGDRRGRPWFIAIRHPRDKTREIASLPLADLAVSTSGDYERFYDDENGVRYHHILNPKTGDSARESQSVTIVANDSTTADALSTSIFVMGAEAGLALINKMPGISAVVVDKNGQVFYSDDLQAASKERTH